jgi:hypothetical protein
VLRSTAVFCTGRKQARRKQEASILKGLMGERGMTVLTDEEDLKLGTRHFLGQ